MTSMDEQETTVAAGRGEEHVFIYTTNTMHLKRLRSDNRVAEVSGDEDFGYFQVPTAIYDPLSGFKRQQRIMSEVEKQAARDRMAKAREAKRK